MAPSFTAMRMTVNQSDYYKQEIKIMLITEILARNARMFGQQTALIEREPAKNRRVGN